MGNERTLKKILQNSLSNCSSWRTNCDIIPTIVLSSSSFSISFFCYQQLIFLLPCHSLLSLCCFMAQSFHIKIFFPRFMIIITKVKWKTTECDKMLFFSCSNHLPSHYVIRRGSCSRAIFRSLSIHVLQSWRWIIDWKRWLLPIERVYENCKSLIRWKLVFLASAVQCSGCQHVTTLRVSD